MSQLKENNVLVDVRDLAVYFHIEQGIVKAVDGVSFKIEKGKSLGVVGESGCGKTITALSLLLLHPQPEGHIEKGNIFFSKSKIILVFTIINPKKFIISFFINV